VTEPVAVEFTVYGVPVPQGSKRVFRGNVVEMADARLRSWRQDVAAAANAQMDGLMPFTRPVAVQLHFHLDRPKGHYGTGRNEDRLKPSAPVAPGVKPDLDKLIRSVLDAITGVVIKDDSQVVSLVAGKFYSDGGTRPGLSCQVLGF
jgi:crossover junction endodeoxyribonuclease RusA